MQKTETLSKCVLRCQHTRGIKQEVVVKRGGGLVAGTEGLEGGGRVHRKDSGGENAGIGDQT